MSNCMITFMPMNRVNGCSFVACRRLVVVNSLLAYLDLKGGWEDLTFPELEVLKMRINE